LDRRVAAAIQACLTDGGTFANPSSIHVAGRASAALVARARSRLADLLGTDPTRITWTSGATEANNLAIIGAAKFRAHRGKHLVTMLTEHKAVTETFAALEKEGFEVSWLRPDADGLLSPEVLLAAIREDTQLVSVMHVNNETGVIQDIHQLGALCRARDVLFHTDAAQSVGKLPLNLSDLPVDLLSLTAHKFYGPQGIGALYIAERPGCHVLPLTFGGGQERGLRPGTLPVHLIEGIGVAAAIAAEQMQQDLDHVTSLRQQLWSGLGEIADLTRNGAPEDTYPGILNVSAAGVEGESLMLGLEPVCVASGSACNSSSGESSYVLKAHGLDDSLAQSAVRFSFGRMTSAADIDIALGRYQSALSHLRAIAPIAGTGP
jgi:cysteine desulfurase